jgi:predicted metal-dependent hydrolase
MKLFDAILWTVILLINAICWYCEYEPKWSQTFLPLISLVLLCWERYFNERDWKN